MNKLIIEHTKNIPRDDIKKYKDTLYKKIIEINDITNLDYFLNIINPNIEHLYFSIHHKRYDIFLKILNKINPPKKTLHSLNMFSCKEGHLKPIKMIKQKYPDIDLSNMYNANIIYAIQGGHMDIIYYLASFPEVQKEGFCDEVLIYPAISNNVVLIELLDQLPFMSRQRPWRDVAYKKALIYKSLDVKEYFDKVNNIHPITINKNQ